MQEDLTCLITQIIQDLGSEKKIDSRVVSYDNYKSKYVVLKPSVTVEVALTDGKVIKIDISDYFKGVIK